MTQDPHVVQILEKEYVVCCPTGQEPSLREAAMLLDQKMRDIRQSGRVVGIERIAIMAALNIAHEALLAKIQPPTDPRLQALYEQIDSALETTN